MMIIVIVIIIIIIIIIIINIVTELYFQSFFTEETIKEACPI
jgi:hypothetical protein